MGRPYKIVVSGPFNSGKTEFVRAASDIPVVSTERRISDDLSAVKGTTTVAMDYGHTTVGGCMFHLFGTPGQERFEFMWDILGQEMDGLLLLVDSTDRASLVTARRILRRFRRLSKAPVLVIATRHEQPQALTPKELAERLRVGPADVVLCDPRKKKSARLALQALCTALS